MEKQGGKTEREYWPFLDASGRPLPGAAKAISLPQVGPEARAITADWRGGDWRGDWRSSLRARPSLLASGERQKGRPAVALGWHPDVPDVRDKPIVDTSASKRLETATSAAVKGGHRKAATGLPSRHENLRWCSPIEDQGELGSYTAQAVVGLMEFMQRRTGTYVDGSRLFVYKVSRRLLGWTGDTGAYLRTTIKAVSAFGVPPEEYWPYDISKYEEEPDAFLYSFAQSYQALEYTRVDMPGRSAGEVLDDIKRVIAGGLGVVFGFSVYSSLTGQPDIPFPSASDALQGGHAVMAVGYDDDHQPPDQSTRGALVIRNSWGTGWGVGGYGFLPYEYVLKGLAEDFWTVLKSEWLELKVFN